MAKKELTDAQKKLFEQFDRVPMDDELKDLVYTGLLAVNDEEALSIAKDLKEALDALPKALKHLEKLGRKLGQ